MAARTYGPYGKIEDCEQSTEKQILPRIFYCLNRLKFLDERSTQVQFSKLI